MKKSIHSAIFTPAVFLAVPAMAEITATQAWDNLVELYESSGMTVDATQTLDGGTLTVSDIELNMIDPSDVLFKQILSDAIVFEELGDGTVRIVLPQTMTSEIELRDEDRVIPLTLDFSHENLDVIVSGTPENAVFDFTGDQIRYGVDGFEAEPGQSITAGLTGRDIRGSYSLEDGDGSQLVSEFLADAVDFDLNYAGEENAAMSLTSQLAGVSIVGSGALAGFGNLETEALSNIDSKVAIQHAGAEFNGVMSEANAGESTIKGGSDSGSFEFEVTPEIFSYVIAGSGLRADIESASMPIPGLGYAMDNYAFDLTMPIGVSDTPEDFNLLARIGELSISDGLWSLFDPSEVLPRDPATLVVDLSGKANMLIDVFSPDFVAEASDDVPGELHEATLNELSLSVAGAELSADGGFTFDNTDLETFDGLPRPEGQVDVRVDGVNGLIDGLLELGYVQEAQLVGARMMMAIFSNAVEGEDAITSSLQVDETGSVFANGQQLR